VLSDWDGLGVPVLLSCLLPLICSLLPFWAQVFLGTLAQAPGVPGGRTTGSHAVQRLDSSWPPRWLEGQRNSCCGGGGGAAEEAVPIAARARRVGEPDSMAALVQMITGLAAATTLRRWVRRATPALPTAAGTKDEDGHLILDMFQGLVQLAEPSEE
ncbi:unnamed protein product, partial [Prorocentrum cordatum]